MSDKNLFGELPPPPPKPLRSSKPSTTTRPKFSWFFALRPSVEDAQRIFATAGVLLTSNKVSGARITPDRLHITLEWIGDDIDEELVNRACLAASTIEGPALEAGFNAIKTFPAPSAPCILLGSEGLDAVRRLRSDLVAAMKDQGLKAARNYEPHMTLCYDRVHRLPRTAIDPISFRTGEFALVKSHLGLSRHEVMRTWRLTD